jgi:uncharacterized protein YecE (DUF72 family)
LESVARQRLRSAGEVEEFVSAARLLGDKLLCCTLQFGYFNRVRFARPEPFLQLLDSFLGAWPKDITVAVEIRNKNWLSEAYADCLRRHDAVWVLTDQAWMLPPLKVAESIDVVTGPFAYIRLLGDRETVDTLRPGPLRRAPLETGRARLAGCRDVARMGGGPITSAFPSGHVPQ